MVVIGRGRGKKTLTPRDPSTRTKRKSRRQILSEETEVYLSASDEFPPADIILHGSNNNTVDTIEIYEDSILEDEDSVFEVSTIVDEDKSVVAGDSAEIGSDVKEVATDNNDGKIVDEVKVLVGENVAIVDDDKEVVATEDAVIVDEVNKVVAGGEGLTLVSMPEGVRSIDPKYVTDISFAMDRSIPDLPDHIKKCLENMCHLSNIHSSIPALCVTEDLIDPTEKDDFSDHQVHSVCENDKCINCLKLEEIVANYQVSIFQLGEEKNIREEEHHFEISALKRENETLYKRENDTALLRQQLKKQDIRILELTSDDRIKNEIQRLEKAIEVNDDEIMMLNKKLETSATEIFLLKNNLQFYMDQNTRLKNSMKVAKSTENKQSILVDVEKDIDFVKKDKSNINKKKPVPIPRTKTAISPVIKSDTNRQCWLRSADYGDNDESPSDDFYYNDKFWLRPVENDHTVATMDGIHNINTVSQLSYNPINDDEGIRFAENSTNDISGYLDNNNNSLQQNVPPIPTRPPPPVNINSQQTNYTKRIVPGDRLYSQAHNRVEHRGVIAGVEQINQCSANGVSTHNNVVSDTHQNLIRVEENSLNSTSSMSRNEWLRPTHPPSNTETSLPNCPDMYNNLPTTFPTPSFRTDLKLLIASSSITKGINVQRFNECFGSGTARIQKWPGGRARHMKNYIGTHLEEENPDIVIVQAGGNDLAERDRFSITSIANDVMEIAIKARNSGVQDVFIGGVPIRRDQFDNEDLHELNHAISTMCRQHGFFFVDNSKIGVGHLYDGVHLNTAGTTILACNYLEALRVKYRGYYT